jgi:hypothetical protein
MSVVTKINVDVLALLRVAVLAKGGKVEDLELLRLPVVMEAFAETLLRYVAMLGNVRPLTIDYSRPFDQMIAAGKYGYVNPDITAEHFPITSKGVVQTEIILVPFDRNISSDDVEKELAAMGLEPARLEHATAFGEKYPDVQREYPIVFLGSVWSDSNGSPHVPCLDDWRDRRRLDLSYRGGEWIRDYRFAAVRKVLPAMSAL